MADNHQSRPEQRVEMRPAYDWTCPECGRDNFCRSIVAEVTPEHCEEMGLEGEEAEDLMSGRWMTYPNNVVCQHCGERFKTMGMGQEEIEGDEEEDDGERGDCKGDGDG